MENKYGIVGVAHIGLPTNDLQKTVEFYKSLGFEVIMQMCIRDSHINDLSIPRPVGSCPECHNKKNRCNWCRY